MITIRGRNVNEIYRKAREILPTIGVRQSSRAGTVLAAPHPVMSVYERPCERVLWDASRDANPFFHLCESLWMLAGRDDSQLLNEFVQDFGERFAESGGRIHGAYGARWRRHWDGDQLSAIVARLRRDPLDRRCVISMWDPTMDLVNPDEVSHDLHQELDVVFQEPRDLPCNTHLYPRVVGNQLDLTVLCRSNDIIWGAYGANAVHFSVLQEYLAAAIGVTVGTMYQLSNNWHAYESALARHPAPQRGTDFYDHHLGYVGDAPIGVSPSPLVTNPETFLAECVAWCQDPLNEYPRYTNKFLHETATYVARVNQIRKTNKRLALGHCDAIKAPDWRLACRRWLERRLEPSWREERDGRDK